MLFNKKANDYFDNLGIKRVKMQINPKVIQLKKMYHLKKRSLTQKEPFLIRNKFLEIYQQISF
ncbi:hypothetical protein DJ013_18365 [Arcticibacterium luteifluviistationis]|uniref:Uncharacterized protein n=1 Tax=Arcticibacterium luteifluviistationis TaxID=1784714 RepID=A0A2Z4GG98_9BACT|nr:hypothetical protein DJ013_18365 [Arcticibacterium luteifluviistationis]